MTAKVSIKSDGTPDNTHVLVDGKPVDCTDVVVTFSVDGLARVTMTLYVDDVDLNGACELHTSAVYKANQVGSTGGPR